MKITLAKAFSVSLAIISSTIPVFSATAAAHFDSINPANKHKRQALAHQRRSSEIEKRDFSGTNVGATWYVIDDGNPVACGGFYQPSDFVIAMNHEMFDSGDLCGETVTITYQGNSQQGVIVDRCAGCGWGFIDLTRGLFSAFSNPGNGEIWVDWYIGTKPTPTPPPPPPPKPTHTHTDKPPPPPPSTTSISSTQSTSAEPSSTPTIPSGLNNIALLLDTIVGLGTLAFAGAQV